MTEARRYPRRLVEVDLPIRAISENARREKSTSTITGLHMWWARRPLAACRAVVCASLWLDPADPSSPKAYLAEVEKTLRLLGDTLQNEPGIADLFGASLPRFNKLISQKKLNPSALREALLLFIAGFSGTKCSLHPTFIGYARRITDSAHRAGSSSPAPIVFDPFAGGGSIPLEALRAGASAIAADVNPVALLINDVIIGKVPHARGNIREEIRDAVGRIKEIAHSRLSPLYPQKDGRTPVAYLWARTILSEAPDSEGTPIEVPMIRSMWLSKRPGNLTAMRWVRDAKGRIICDDVELLSSKERVKVRRPRLEIFNPSANTKLDPGTAAGGGATCPVTGFTTPKASVRTQLMKRQGGARDARLLAIATRSKVETGRRFYVPDDADYRALKKAAADFESSPWKVVEPLPGGKVWKNNPFRVHNYGMLTWGDLFTQRQHLVLSVLADLIRGDAEATRQKSASNDIIQALLALSVARLADHLNSCCTWNPTGEKPQHLFARQAVPMVWDFCEANPLGGSVGDWAKIVDGAVDALDFVPQTSATSDVIQASASDCPLPDDSVDATITDPPYYDAVPYADLSEFFYVWLRRCVPKSRGAWFASPHVDRTSEIVFDENRSKTAEFYVKEMTSALREARRVTKPNGIGVVVFAHKSTAGWESLLQALLDAGWTVTASWPIDTELATRIRAMGSAALASSVHLICRPREDEAGNMDASVGGWRDVIEALPLRIREWLPRLSSEGIVGADAIFACLGPALEIFSKYSRVEKVSGEEVLLREYLEHVWAAVSREALSMVFQDADTSDLEPDARLTAMWLWTLVGPTTPESSVDDLEAEDSGEEDEPVSSAVGKFSLEYDAARKIAQGLGARLEELASVVELKGDKARLRTIVERSKHLLDAGDAVQPTQVKKAKQLSLFKESDSQVAEVDAVSSAAPKPGSTTLDRLHQTMLLFASGRSVALKRFLVEDGVGKQPQFWKLAQSLSALYPAGSDEKRWVDGVLARKKGLGF